MVLVVSKDDKEQTNLIIEGKKIRDLYDLRKAFDITTFLTLFRNGELLSFLEQGNYIHEYRRMKALELESGITNFDLVLKICKILGVNVYPMEIMSQMPEEAVEVDKTISQKANQDKPVAKIEAFNALETPYLDYITNEYIEEGSKYERKRVYNLRSEKLTPHDLVPLYDEKNLTKCLHDDYVSVGSTKAVNTKKQLSHTRPQVYILRSEPPSFFEKASATKRRNKELCSNTGSNTGSITGSINGPSLDTIADLSANPSADPIASQEQMHTLPYHARDGGSSGDSYGADNEATTTDASHIGKASSHNSETGSANGFSATKGTGQGICQDLSHGAVVRDVSFNARYDNWLKAQGLAKSQEPSEGNEPAKARPGRKPNYAQLLLLPNVIATNREELKHYAPLKTETTYIKGSYWQNYNPLEGDYVYHCHPKRRVITEAVLNALCCAPRLIETLIELENIKAQTTSFINQTKSLHHALSSKFPRRDLFSARPTPNKSASPTQNPPTARARKASSSCSKATSRTTPLSSSTSLQLSFQANQDHHVLDIGIQEPESFAQGIRDLEMIANSHNIILGGSLDGSDDDNLANSFGRDLTHHASQHLYDNHASADEMAHAAPIMSCVYEGFAEHVYLKPNDPFDWEAASILVPQVSKDYDENHRRQNQYTKRAQREQLAMLVRAQANTNGNSKTNDAKASPLEHESNAENEEGEEFNASTELIDCTCAGVGKSATDSSISCEVPEKALVVSIVGTNSSDVGDSSSNFGAVGADSFDILHTLQTGVAIGRRKRGRPKRNDLYDTHLNGGIYGEIMESQAFKDAVIKVETYGYEQYIPTSGVSAESFYDALGKLWREEQSSAGAGFIENYDNREVVRYFNASFHIELTDIKPRYPDHPLLVKEEEETYQHASHLKAPSKFFTPFRAKEDLQKDNSISRINNINSAHANIELGKNQALSADSTANLSANKGVRAYFNFYRSQHFRLKFVNLEFVVSTKNTAPAHLGDGFVGALEGDLSRKALLAQYASELYYGELPVIDASAFDISDEGLNKTRTSFRTAWPNLPQFTHHEGDYRQIKIFLDENVLKRRIRYKLNQGKELNDQELAYIAKKKNPKAIPSEQPSLWDELYDKYFYAAAELEKKEIKTDEFKSILKGVEYIDVSHIKSAKNKNMDYSHYPSANNDGSKSKAPKINIVNRNLFQLKSEEGPPADSQSPWSKNLNPDLLISHTEATKSNSNPPHAVHESYGAKTFSDNYSSNTATTSNVISVNEAEASASASVLEVKDEAAFEVKQLGSTESVYFENAMQGSLAPELSDERASAHIDDVALAAGNNELKKIDGTSTFAVSKVTPLSDGEPYSCKIKTKYVGADNELKACFDVALDERLQMASQGELFFGAIGLSPMEMVLKSKPMRLTKGNTAFGHPWHHQKLSKDNEAKSRGLSHANSEALNKALIEHSHYQREHSLNGTLCGYNKLNLYEYQAKFGASFKANCQDQNFRPNPKDLPCSRPTKHAVNKPKLEFTGYVFEVKVLAQALLFETISNYDLAALEENSYHSIFVATENADSSSHEANFGFYADKTANAGNATNADNNGNADQVDGSTFTKEEVAWPIEEMQQASSSFKTSDKSDDGLPAYAEIVGKVTGYGFNHTHCFSNLERKAFTKSSSHKLMSDELYDLMLLESYLPSAIRCNIHSVNVGSVGPNISLLSSETKASYWRFTDVCLLQWVRVCEVMDRALDQGMTFLPVPFAKGKYDLEPLIEHGCSLNADAPFIVCDDIAQNTLSLIYMKRKLLSCNIPPWLYLCVFSNFTLNSLLLNGKSTLKFANNDGKDYTNHEPYVLLGLASSEFNCSSRNAHFHDERLELQGLKDLAIIEEQLLKDKVVVIPSTAKNTLAMKTLLRILHLT